MTQQEFQQRYTIAERLGEGGFGEVVKNYVRRKDCNFDKLIKYEHQLRIENIMQNLIIPTL